MKKKPPYRAYKFLRWFCKPSLFEEISGDLEEEFQIRYKEESPFKARLSYWIQVFSFFRPFALGIKINLLSMTLFKNHALIAIRMMNKHKLFTSINILGLTLSMIIGLVLITIIIDQKSFDKFHSNYDRIYRITTKSQFLSYEPGRMATTTIPLSEELSRDHIEELVRIRRSLNTDLISGSEAKTKTISVNGHFADSEFFKIFSFDLLAGDPGTALKDPFSLVLTEKLALKIFNSIDVIGQIVTLKDLGEFTISGVMLDIPRQSHFQFELLASFSTVEILENSGILWPTINNWRDYSSNYIYFLIKAGGKIGPVKSEMDEISRHQYGQYEDLDINFNIQPMSQIALGADMGNQIGPTTEKEFIIGITILAFVIFIAAIFNYTNLSVARSLKRGREVGLRKVMGSTKFNIISQFVLESVIIALMALAFAMLLFELLKPSLIPYMPNRYLSLQFTPEILIAFISIALFAGLISGIIPSLVMTRINIAEIIKQNSASSMMRRINIRKGVLVFQFTLSMVFTVVAIVAWRQFNFGINYDTGFKKENIYNVYLQGNDPEIAKERFMQILEVQDVSFSGFVLSSGTVQNTWLKMDDPSDSMLVSGMSVDDKFTDIHEIQLVAGHRFSRTGGNQAMINLFVLDYFKISTPEEAIGRKLVSSDGQEMEIAAVTSNFFTNDVGKKREGFFMYYKPDSRYGVANLAVDYSDPKALESKIKSIWKDLDENVHDYRGDFFSDQLIESYSGLTFIIEFVGTLAVLVILIASLGLLGMVIYTVEHRIREIGIRKTMGADEIKIVGLLSSGFLKLIVIAAIIAIVVAWVIVFQVILPNMVDKPEIGVLEFLTAFIILVIPTISTILPAVIRASRTNPAIVLRSE